jgi:HEAT repeat protein
MVNPASLPGDPDKPTAQPVDPAPVPAVSTGELVKQLEKAEDRQVAAVALAAKGKEAIPALTKALDHSDWQVRAAAVFALGKIGKDAAAAKDKLQAIAEKDENEEVRVAATFALDALAE